MSKNGLARLDVSNVFKLAQQVEEDDLPRLLEAMRKKIADDDTSLKELTSAFRALASFTRSSQRLDDELGITTRRGGNQGTVFNIIAKNLTLDQVRGLTEEQKQELLLSALDGDTARVATIVGDDE